VHKLEQQLRTPHHKSKPGKKEKAEAGCLAPGKLTPGLLITVQIQSLWAVYKYLSTAMSFFPALGENLLSRTFYFSKFSFFPLTSQQYRPSDYCWVLLKHPKPASMHNLSHKRNIKSTCFISCLFTPFHSIYPIPQDIYTSLKLILGLKRELSIFREGYFSAVTSKVFLTPKTFRGFHETHSIWS